MIFIKRLDCFQLFFELSFFNFFFPLNDFHLKFEAFLMKLFKFLKFAGHLIWLFGKVVFEFIWLVHHFFLGIWILWWLLVHYFYKINLSSKKNIEKKCPFSKNLRYFFFFYFFFVFNWIHFVWVEKLFYEGIKLQFSLSVDTFGVITITLTIIDAQLKILMWNFRGNAK